MGLLFGVVLNPSLLYANRTIINQYSIYHEAELNEELLARLANITVIVRKSELYDSNFNIDICLNDGSLYPRLLEKIRGQAFAWGFYNKVVLQGKVDCKNNTIELNGNNWNFEHLLAHEAVHCFQYNELGFWNSNPIANLPTWKWEGYAEYISRQGKDQSSLHENIESLKKFEKENKDAWAYIFMDGTISPIAYYRDRLLVRYCLNIKQLSFIDLLQDTTKKEQIESEMMSWMKKEREWRTQ
jgi:hypothetical protein